jgi:nucleoside-diphosphate-sugar epimerase
MRIFVTGATGFVGTVVVRELIGAGHQVLGLARSDGTAAALRAAGASVHRGSLEDPTTLKDAAASADGVIHTAFNHDFSKFKENCETDRRAIGALGAACVGSDRPLIVTSGTGLLAGTPLAREDDPLPAAHPIPRIASEHAADEVRALGVRVAVMRLPPSVHGTGDHGFVPHLIGLAREKGVSAYIEAGANCWPAVHRLDAARLYRLALEKPGVSGARYHAVAEEGIAFRDIAALIGRRLNVPVVSLSEDKGAAHFGWFAPFAAFDNRASSEKTRRAYSWQPTQPGLLSDLEQGGYFGS